jgi:hypothetical protein
MQDSSNLLGRFILPLGTKIDVVLNQKQIEENSNRSKKNND